MEMAQIANTVKMATEAFCGVLFVAEQTITLYLKNTMCQSQGLVFQIQMKTDGVWK